MKITEKGQVTIPVAIRERLGLLPHTEVEFVVRKGEAVLRKLEERPGRGRRIVQRLRGRATTGMSTEEILSLTREPEE